MGDDRRYSEGALGLRGFLEADAWYQVGVVSDMAVRPVMLEVHPYRWPQIRLNP
jgi:hypothetical protein